MTDLFNRLPEDSQGASERHARIVLDSYERLLGRPLLQKKEGGACAMGDGLADVHADRVPSDG